MSVRMNHPKGPESEVRSSLVSIVIRIYGPSYRYNCEYSALAAKSEAEIVRKNGKPFSLLVR